MNKYTSLLLSVILAFAFFTRIWQLHLPETYIFDEVYHAVTSKLIARNDPQAYEWWAQAPEPNTAVDWLHPPLAKYTQALSLQVFGETTFGWRLSAALFGVGVIYLTFKLGQKLFNEEVGLLGAFLASLDGLLLTQSRIAMNDIHVTFFIVLTLLVYLHYLDQKLDTKVATRWLLLTGLSAGLALASKWSGLFVVALVGFSEIWNAVTTHPLKIKTLSLRAAKIVLFLGVIPLGVYVLSYSHMFLQGKTLFCNQEKYIPNECYYEVVKWGEKVIYQGYISHFAMLHRQIWHYQTHLEASHTYQSRPWQWFLNVRPVWFYVDYETSQIANIYAFGNPALFWFGDAAVFASITMIGYYLVTKKWAFKGGASLLFLLAAYFIVWLPWQLSPRIMFFYHYTPAVPLLSLILGYWLSHLLHLKNRKVKIGYYLVGFILTLVTLVFIVWYPHWTGRHVPVKFAEKVYFVLPSWK